MVGLLFLIVGCVLTALALVMLYHATVGRRRSRRGTRFLEEADSGGLYDMTVFATIFGLAFVGFGLLLLTESLTVAVPLLAAVWFFGGLWFICKLCGHRQLRWLSYLSGGVGGLILVMVFPAILDWGYLYLRGISVRAEVVSMMVGSTYDPDGDGYSRFPVTHVTYQFEAEVDGQPRQFRREGELSGRYRMGSGFVRVLYDPADPSHSRMIREFHWTRHGLVAAAVFLTLGAWFFLISRQPGGARKVGEAPRR